MIQEYALSLSLGIFTVCFNSKIDNSQFFSHFLFSDTSNSQIYLCHMGWTFLLQLLSNCYSKTSVFKYNYNLINIIICTIPSIQMSFMYWNITKKFILSAPLSTLILHKTSDYFNYAPIYSLISVLQMCCSLLTCYFNFSVFLNTVLGTIPLLILL